MATTSQKPKLLDQMQAENKFVLIRVAYGEIQLGRMLRSSGGRWNKEKKLWEVRYEDVILLGLEDRMVHN